MNPTIWFYIAMLGVTLVAGITDLRRGLIPNWLTFPVLVAAPLLHGLSSGLNGLFGSLIGLFVSGLVPFIFHRLGAMGGGDVKLFAALGALAGPSMGLQIQLLALACAFFWGLLVLTYRGRLWGVFKNSVRIAINPLLPAKHRREVAAEQLTSMRIGASIFAGTALAVVDRLWFGGVLAS